MKQIRTILLLWLVLAGFLANAQVAKLIKPTISKTGVVAYWREKVAGVHNKPEDWERLTQVQYNALIKVGAALSKPVNLNYNIGYASLNLGLYQNTIPGVWPNGFEPSIFYRRNDQPLAAQLKLVRLMEAGQGWSAEEQANPALKSRQYYDVPAGTFGSYEQWYNMVDASVQTVLNHLAGNLNGNVVGAARVVYNFENYPPQNIGAYNNPTDNYEQKGVLQFYPDAGSRTWVCESPDLVGQTKTLQWLWDNGKFNNEVKQRLINRHVAILKWTKAKCGSSTKVVNGDGNLGFFNGNVSYLDNYQEVYTGNGSSSAFMTIGANFPATSAGGVTVSGGGQRFWDVQDFVNNYSYVGQGYLNPSDFDQLASSRQSYEWFWARVEPGPGHDDINIPAGTVLNRLFATRYGRTLGVTWQGHNRFEFGVRRKGSLTSNTFFYPNQANTTTGLGRDGAIMPDYLLRTYALVQWMAGGDLTMWTTWKQAGPGAGTEANEASNRPLNDWMGLFSGLAQAAQFKEYTDPARSPKYFALDDVYVKYTNGIQGGDWGSMKTDGGDGYWKRGAGMIANHQNPNLTADPRSTCGVQARVIKKNGALWALIVATNHRQGRNQLSTFNVRFKAADVGSTTDLDVTGLSVSGWEPTVIEVCLEPSKQIILTMTPVGTVTAPPASTTTSPVSATGVPFEPTATDASAWGGSDMLILDNGQVRAGFRRSVGGQLCRLLDPRYNEPLINDYKVVRNGVSESDKGRQANFAFYGTPGLRYIQGGYNTNATGNDLGWNPVFGGNRNSDESSNWNAAGTVVKMEQRTVSGVAWTYIMTRAPHWSLPVAAGLAEADLEVWYRLDGPALKWVTRGTIRRTDTQRKYEGREQEWPCAYATATQYRHFVWQGSSTLASSAMTDITLPEPNGGSLAGEARHVSIPFVLALNNNNRGFAQLMMGGRTRNRQFYSRFGNEDSNESSYIGDAPIAECDENGQFVFRGAFVVGTESELRAWYDAQPAQPAGFDYQFTAMDRQFWWSLDGAFKNVNGAPLMDFGQANFDGCRVCGTLSSPIRTFQASAASTVYIRGAFSGVSQMRLTFSKPGPESANDAGGVDFSVNGDGQVRTYAVNLSGQANWSGLISRLKLQHATSTTSSQISTAWFRPIRITSTQIN